MSCVTLDKFFKGSAFFCPDNVKMHIHRRVHIWEATHNVCTLLLLHEIERLQLCCIPRQIQCIYIYFEIGTKKNNYFNFVRQNTGHASHFVESWTFDENAGLSC